MRKNLGKREREVLLLSFLSRKDVAAVQGVTESTINTQRMQIMYKLGADNLVEAVLIALKKGIVKLEDFEL